MREIEEIAGQIIDDVSKIVIGKREQIKLVVMAILSGGHILFDDLPGVGKTTLVKVISRVMGCSFSRVQFTPDLLPSDIIGMNVFNQKSGEFNMRPGPILTHIFLADEINRALPRTQSALLEAMEELQITVDGVTYPLPAPFLVLATQNPVEMESTFHLPVAQMDRFFIRLSLGYPSHDDEVEMLRVVGDEQILTWVAPLLNAEKISELQVKIRDVFISDGVLHYIVSLVEATRQSELLRLPVSPRGSRSLYRASKAWAAMAGRNYVTPDDVKALAPYVLSHRMAVAGEARLNGKQAADILQEILAGVAAPAAKEEILRAK
ncbi:MAG: MoxR family ATPase [Peptococcaceae bacterium]|jgi:MoxR-like ATPase|nr:MoxR family ATPase [Peptococcaceae bacterium]